MKEHKCSGHQLPVLLTCAPVESTNAAELQRKSETEQRQRLGFEKQSPVNISAFYLRKQM